MSAIVQAIDVVVRDMSSRPLSLGVGPGEIVGLLFPPARPRAPILRALGGLDPPAAGEVRLAAGRRIVVAAPGPDLADALAERPDLVLLDAANDVANRSMWALLASERALGTSFVVATASFEQAGRADRVSLASWDRDELTRGLQELARRMTSQVQEFLAVLGEARHRGAGAQAANLRRLNAGARALLVEMRLRIRSSEDDPALWRATEELSGASLSDRLLDAVIAEERER